MVASVQVLVVDVSVGWSYIGPHFMARPETQYAIVVSTSLTVSNNIALFMRCVLICTGNSVNLKWRNDGSNWWD